MQSLKLFVSAAMLLLVGMFAQGGTITANFGTNWNFLTSGVQGPFWDGFYIGNSDIAYTGTAANQGNTTNADQNITSNNLLTINSVNTDFGDGPNDDGVFLYKVVSNDFSVIVRINPPFNNGAFNEAGLQARAFDNNTGRAAGNSEDWVGNFRFDQFGFGIIYRNTVNGGLAAGNPDAGASLANTNTYWMRIDRIAGTNFQYFYGSNGVDWVDITSGFAGATNRPDFAGVPLQVGLHHSTFNDSAAGAPNSVRYEGFSLTSTDFDAYVTMPDPVTGLTATTNGGQNIDLTWANAGNATNTLIVVYSGTTGTNANNWRRYAPASGFGYTADNRYGFGDSLLTSNENFIVYSSSGTSLTVSNLVGGQSYRAVAYAYNGSGASATYNHQSTQVTFTSSATPTGLTLTGPSAPIVAGSGRTLTALLNFNNGSQKNVSANSVGSTTTYGSSASNIATVPVQGRLSTWSNGSVTISVTNVFVSGGVTNTNTASLGPLTVIAGSITHRYSFNEAATDGGGNVTTNFSDTVGSANGTVVNAHSDVPQITWPGNGTMLFDSGISTYAVLPADLFTNQGALTVETWFNADTTAANAGRIIDAGSDTAHSLFLNNTLTGSMNAGNGATAVNATRPIAGNHHIVWVNDGANRFYILYVDGVRVGLTQNAVLTPENVGAEPNVYLGRSQTGNFNLAAIDELRTYNYPLDPLSIAAHTGYGTGVTNNDPGTATALAISLTSPLTQDDSAQATVTGTFTGAGSINVTTVPQIVYSSSNTNIATVNSNGFVVAISPGNVNIVATGFSLSATQALQVLAVVPVMQHRYTFNAGAGDINDIIGGANGSPNNVTWTNRVLPNGTTNAEVVLTPTGATAKTSYLILPNDLIANQSSVSFEMWYTERTRRNWARLWDFGNNTARYLFGSPNAANANTRNAILVPGSTPGGEQQVNGALFPVGVEHHVVYTQEAGSKTAKFYMDGALIGQNTNVTDRPRDIGPTQFDYVGASQFGDPDFDGFFNEFRIYNYALSPFQVLLNGASADLFVSETNVGALVSISASATNMTAGGLQQQTVVLANWANLTNVPVQGVSSNWVSSNPGVLKVNSAGVLTAVAAGNATITATYSNLVGTTASITVNAAATPTVSHRWSFTGDLTDSVGGATGTNIGGAVVTGSRLVLGGATNSYVRLPGHLFDGAGDMTFETWAAWADQVGGTNPSGVAISDFGGAGLVDPTATNNWFRITPLRNASIMFRYQFGTGVQTLLSKDNPVPGTNNMHHLLFSINTVLGQTAFYLDGELKDRWPHSIYSPRQVPGSLTNVEGYFGHAVAEVTSNLVGVIDEYRMWQGAMSPAQAQTSFKLGPDAVNPLNSGAISSLSIRLVDPTTVVGLIQRPIVSANFANVSNVDLTFDPALAFSSSNTNVAVVTPADTWGSSRIQAVGAGSANIVASYGGITATGVVTVVTPPALRAMHRYSFFSDASDSVGKGDGKAYAATISGHKVQFTGLNIPESYVNLPADLISGYDKMTIEAFATFTTAANGFPRLFDFGDHIYASANYTGSSYLFFTAATGAGAAGNSRVALLPFGGAEAQANGVNMAGVTAQVVITLDSSSQIENLYTNGVLVQSTTNANVNPRGIVDNFNWLARSQFQGDQMFIGSIDDFRIYYGVMDSNTVASSFAIGADPEKLSAATDGLGNTIVSWANFPPFTDGWTLQRTLDLTPTAWLNVGIGQVTNAGRVSVTVPIGATNTAYFRLAK